MHPDDPNHPTDVIGNIRLRPGMYIGNTGSPGLEHLIYELVGNSVDQFLAQAATQVTVARADDHTLIVSDDGPGLPYDVLLPSGISKAEQWLTNYHNSPTADDHSPHVHLYGGGVGLVAVNALSESLQVITHRTGQRWEQSFSQGKPLSAPVSSPSDEHGTELRFKPDRSIFKDTIPRWGNIRRKLFDSAHLFPGLLIHCNRETFHAPHGLSDLVEFTAARFPSLDHASEPPRSVSLRIEKDGIRIDASAHGLAKSCEWRSWCNGQLTTQHGTHVDGFLDALRQANWTPAVAMINILMTHPQFAAPTRDKLVAPHVREIIKEVILSHL